jgi:hypothetical protein
MPAKTIAAGEHHTWKTGSKGGVLKITQCTMHPAGFPTVNGVLIEPGAAPNVAKPHVVKLIPNYEYFLVAGASYPVTVEF